MTQEALKLALDALENHTAIKHPQQIHYRDKAITAIKEALAQPEQEPVVWYRDEGGIRIYYETKAWDDCIALYTHPPQRSESSGKPSAWVGLTNEEIDSCFEDHGWSPSEDYYPVIKDIEAKLKEKNMKK